MVRCWERAGARVVAPRAALMTALLVPASVVTASAVTAALLVGLLVAAPATPVLAHARVTGSAPQDGEVVPTAPTDVNLFLDAKPATVEGDPLQVYGPDGRRVDKGGAMVSADGRTLTVTLDPDQERPAGEYQVMYRVVSADTHLIAGHTTFSAQAPAPSDVGATGGATDGGSALQTPTGSARAPEVDQPPSGRAPDAPRLTAVGPDGVGRRAVAVGAALVALLAVLGLALRLLRRGRRHRDIEPAAPTARRRHTRTEPAAPRLGIATHRPSSPAYQPAAPVVWRSGSPPRPERPVTPSPRRPHRSPGGAPQRSRAAR